MRLASAVVGFVAIVAASAQAYAADDKVVVLTQYPDEMVNRYEAAFEKAHPGIDVQIVWKMSRDALAMMRQPNEGGVDVYWAAHRGNFPALRDEGRLQPLTLNRSGLPGEIGKQQISDPKGMFEAFEVAGYGVEFNPAYLKQKTLPEPKSWADLANPVYAGHLIMPTASKVPFSPAMYDIILQSQGWTAGWALLVQMAANTKAGANGGEPTGSVVAGEAGLGLTIDFQAFNAIANGRPVAFKYPAGVAYLPAYVGIAKDTTHPRAAAAFVDFVLSSEGQTMLFGGDASRYPVRPAVYAAAPKTLYNPFAGVDGPNGTGSFNYDLDLSLSREPLVITLFDRMIADHYDQLRSTWAALRTAEAAAAKSGDAAAIAALKEARASLVLVPVSEKDATTLSYIKVFSDRRTSPEAETRAAAIEASWTQQLGAAQAKAAAIIQRYPG